MCLVKNGNLVTIFSSSSITRIKTATSIVFIPKVGRAPTLSSVVRNFLLWERLHSILVTYSIVMEGGGGARMNCHLSRVKIYVQRWANNFETMGRYYNTSRWRCRALRNVVQFYCYEVRGMLL